MNKSQAALEFLATYAWAFIVILITIGALYYFGIFDFAKYLPQKCIFPSQFRCLDFSLVSAPAKDVRLKLINNIGEDIRVTALQITDDSAPPISCTPNASFTWQYSKEKDIVFRNCNSGVYIRGEVVELKVSMSYYAVNTPSQPLHVINGKINGRVT